MDPELRAGNTRRADFAENDELPTLEQVRTNGSITITPEMYERMYLTPQNKVTGQLRTTFGNPTPIGLGGFLIAYCPIIFSILGWRGYGMRSITILVVAGSMLIFNRSEQAPDMAQLQSEPTISLVACSRSLPWYSNSSSATASLQPSSASSGPFSSPTVQH